MTMAQGLYIKTYGCQMNTYDSDRMADLLRPHGYTLVESPDLADMVILNTCHIREKATEKVFSELGRLRTLKKNRRAQGGDMIVAVAGCVAQAEGEEITRRAPYVDMVFGPQSYQELPEMLERLRRDGKAIVNTDFPTESKFDLLPIPEGQQNAASFLSIQEGCDKFCTFCCVPYTRGAEYSRPVPEIIQEAQALALGGAVDLTLLGQNVSAFHGLSPEGDLEWGLGDLIRELAKIPGIERLRYTTSHPRDMQEDLIQAHGDVEKLMSYVHLPVQSGSDRILKAMNRKHTADDYRDLVARFRAARPDLAFSSDFIVGFPGETDEDFAQTLKLVRDVGFAMAYSFKYSPRPGTPASVHKDQVPEDIKSERLAMLQQVLNEQHLSFNLSKVGQVLPVLMVRPGRQPGELFGQSPWMQTVRVVGKENLVGRIMNVKITSAGPNNLIGTLE